MSRHRCFRDCPHRRLRGLRQSAGGAESIAERSSSNKARWRPPALSSSPANSQSSSRWTVESCRSRPSAKGSSHVVSIRVAEAGELLEITLDALRRIVQVDAELSDILMRAFILRRAELIATGQGDIVLVGSRHSASTLRVREFLTRNGQPHTYLDADSDPGV